MVVDCIACWTLSTVVPLQTSDLFISLLESISSDAECDSDSHAVVLADNTYGVLDVSWSVDVTLIVGCKSRNIDRLQSVQDVAVHLVPRAQNHSDIRPLEVLPNFHIGVGWRIDAVVGSFVVWTKILLLCVGIGMVTVFRQVYHLVM